MADQVLLTVVDEDGATSEHTVDLPAVLGRDPAQADVVLDDRMVSRRHARLEVDRAGLVVVDLGSGNGTWVGDEQVERRSVVPGEQITVGSTVVRWSLPGGPFPEPDLGSAWCIVVQDGRLRALPLHDLFAAWVAATRMAETLTDTAAARRAFAQQSVTPLVRQTLEACLPDLDQRTTRAETAGAPDPPRLAAALREGTEVFGRHGRATMTDGAGSLHAVCRRLMGAESDYGPGRAHPASAHIQ